MRKSLLAAAAAVVATGAMSSPAWSAACVSAPASTYTASGFTCSVGPVTFSNIQITPTTSGTATIGSITVNPFTSVPGEFGLELAFGSSAINGGSADILWTYNVTGKFITDAFASMNAGASGNGFAFLDEILHQNNAAGAVVGTINLQVPGGPTSDTITFGPQANLYASKDQLNVTFGQGDTARSSQIVNAFSVSGVPGPAVGAGVPGLVAACAGLLALARRRRHQRQTA